jgi:periplasmic protein TonB
MPMLEESTKAEINGAPPEVGSEPNQRRRMLIALALLLVALILVLVKDREFWFPPATTAESESEDQTTSEATAQPHPPAPNGRRTASARPKPKQHAEATTAPTAQTPVAPVIASRAVLPPLEVEVVAGDQHQTVRPGNTSVHVELQGQTPARAPEGTASAAAGGNGGGAATNATERVRLSPGTAQVVSHQVEPTYPLLAKQMKVQGSVVMQALIGKDGNIQNLQVLSGPAILSNAAREAVKQWRFKPYYQSGLPVETEARITVNFTISTQ